MAAASGLTLIAERVRNPLKTTTFGTGELLRAALDNGCKRRFYWSGGSATNDGGVGMAQVLGVSFQDEAGRELDPGTRGLAELDSIHFDGLDPRLGDVEFVVLTNVNNLTTAAKKGLPYLWPTQKGRSLKTWKNWTKLSNILRL